jgi:hypothetical protein
MVLPRLRLEDGDGAQHYWRDSLAVVKPHLVTDSQLLLSLSMNVACEYGHEHGIELILPVDNGQFLDIVGEPGICRNQREGFDNLGLGYRREILRCERTSSRPGLGR